jgi:hypothetical protein
MSLRIFRALLFEFASDSLVYFVNLGFRGVDLLPYIKNRLNVFFQLRTAKCLCQVINKVEYYAGLIPAIL